LPTAQATHLLTADDDWSGVSTTKLVDIVETNGATNQRVRRTFIRLWPLALPLRWHIPVVHTLADERNHVSWTRDRGEAGVEDEFCNSRSRLNFGLENIRL